MVVSLVMTKLPLESADCELLYLLKTHGSLAGITSAIGLDKGYLSRRMTKISTLAPVLIRVQGKWQLTPQGLKIVEWYEEALTKQEMILLGKEELIFGTTQTISERKLTALLPEVIKETHFKKFKMVTQLESVESALLAGKIDFAFVCAIPQSPEVRFKKLIKWPYVIVIPPLWQDHFKTLDDLLRKPYVSHSGIDMRLILGKEEQIAPPVASFDHLIGVREGVVNGLGWSILPLYTIERELKMKSLKLVKNLPKLIQEEEFQLWWVPGNLDKKTVQTIASGLGKLLSEG